ncbi:MAG: HTH domain-containing protein [Candidatus Falkowbacteria bacterium]
MSNNKSILDQIITNHKIEEVAKLDAIEIINSLFGELNKREQDVLTRRFGLHGQDRETLEKIGSVHKLTRERIRQIECSGIKKLRELKNLNDYIAGLKKVINQLLEEHGGLMEREYLINNLVNFSASGFNPQSEEDKIHRNHLDFMISKLLHDELEEVSASKNFKNSFKLKYQTLDHMESLAEELLEKVKDAKKVFITADLINLAKQLKGFQENKEKFETPRNLDISSILGGDHFSEDAGLINSNKALYTIFQAVKSIDQNKFGHWGVYNWREIKPKTINDKIYLILKNHGKPMHFSEIADRINNVSFDSKKANAATVHNELILDDKYVLVGRGLYGLKEWGYSKGTVADVIESILKKSGETFSRDEIIEKALEQRVVKKATVNLALMDRGRFKLKDGKYSIKKEDD